MTGNGIRTKDRRTSRKPAETAYLKNRTHGPVDKKEDYN